MNALYNTARERMVKGIFDWAHLDVVLTAWSGPYHYDETNRYSGDIVTRGGISRAIALKNPTYGVTQEGIVQTAPYVFTTISIGEPVIFFTMSLRSSQAGLDELVCYLDEGFNLPYEPNGLEVVVQPDWLHKRGWFRA